MQTDTSARQEKIRLRQPLTGSTMEANLTSLRSTEASLLSSSKGKADVDSVMDMVQVFFYSVIFLLGSLGNGVVIWITARQTTSKVNCVWFFNLALADFLFSVSRILPLLKNAFYDEWPFGYFLCQTTGFIKYLNMFGSVFLLAVISLDRVTSVSYPVWAKNRRGPRLAWLAAIGAWFVAITTSLPFYFCRVLIVKNNKTKCTLSMDGRGSTMLTLYLLRLVCGFLVPFAIIVVCYGIIAVTLRRRQTIFRSKKPFKVILAIVVTFFICWAPYHLFLLLKLTGVKSKVISVGSPLTSCLAYLNSCVNPILYFFMGLDFRKKLGRFSLAAAFRKTLLEDSAYSLRRPTKHKKEAASSMDDLNHSTVTVPSSEKTPSPRGLLTGQTHAK
ncbi:N-formyl peptide receptor 2-like [Hemicordylus capensis]|uniref:N-formyl peptide receptor 2-like n=1 Tax=Hemicordylus capensis TaxID=884348 RepID=UPI002303719D|nr:N-formyl peptide receptor 2-like [Hemicordylus capensis]